MSGSTTTFGKTGHIVTYTAPVGGLYDIEAIGASGGAGINKGGLAADVGGDVKLTAGEVLSIAVGGTGGLGANGGGGGGGSFVVAPSNVPLVIAGGGGGGNFIPDGSGNGGNGRAIMSSGGGGGNSGGNPGLFSAGGGGGLQGDGLPGETRGGLSFVHGAKGGTSVGGGASGGFGGGGAGSVGSGDGGGGGGGGFTGGDAGRVGVGGTSFDSGSGQHFSVAAQPGDGSVTITLLVSAPVISGTQAEQATTDSMSISPFSNVTITDANPGDPTETVTVIPTNPANGALSDPNAASDGGKLVNGVYSVNGSAAAVTKAVDGLVFTPTKGQVAQGQTVTTGFLLSDASSAGQSTTDDNTSVVSTAGAEPTPTLLTGTPGSDTLVGGSGNDQISGGKGDDFILGGSGNDNLSGDEGNDILIGGLGNDVLHGGLGSDIFLHSAGDGQDTITDFQNGDRLVLAGYTLDLHDLNFANLDTNHDGLLGKGDTSVSFTPDGDLVLNMAAYGAGATPDTVTLKGVAFLHSTDVAVT